MNRLAALLLSALFLGSLHVAASADENPWIRTQIHLASKDQRAALLKSGLDIAEVRGLEADVLVTQSQLDQLRGQGFATHVVQEFSHGPMPRGITTTPEFLPQYYTYTEAAAKLQAIATAYPAITQLTSLGNSLEGRPIWALKISDNASVDEDEPEVLVMGNHHAREAISVIIPLALADSLTMRYGTNPQYTQWVDTREIWIVPTVNPDGLTYSETTLYMWRKNRRNNGSGQFGVDINRNYDYQWGHDDIGSSPLTSDETYRGASPASEPETNAIQAFANSRHFAFSISYHSFGNDLLWGQGFQPGLTADQDVFYRYGQIVTAQNGYLVGNPANSVIYLTNGESDDWMYAGSGHSPVIAMTPEVGTSSDFFNPPASRIPALVVQGLACVWPALQYADRPGQLAPPGPMALDPLPVDGDGNYDVTWALPTIADTAPVLYEIAEKTGPAVVTDGVESGAGNWVLNGWATSTTRKFAGSFSLYSGRGDGLDRILWAKEPYVVQAGDSLSARVWWNLESGWDYLYAVLSTDGGRSFVTLPGTSTSNTDPSTGQNCGNGITGSSGGVFSLQKFSLASWVGQSVLLGFRMNTDANTNNEGVYVDDVSPVQTFATTTSLSAAVPVRSYSISGKGNGTYYYAVRGKDAEGYWGYWSKNLPVTVNLATTVIAGGAPAAFQLSAGRPTPFGTRTEISFQLPVPESHTLDVYDVSGRRVRSLSSGTLSAGAHTTVWDGRDDAGHRVPAGVYFYELRTAQGSLRSRTVLLR
ncbi:MAG: M14 family zinc carboxypeptidase [bacterium]